MPNPENLQPIRTSEEGRRLQLKSAKKRKENREKRMILRDSIIEVLNGTMEVSEAIRQGAGMFGTKLGKKETFGKVATLTILQDVVKKKNWKALAELAKLAGMTHDQSSEALGGSDNPVNISQTTKISAARVKEISEELENEC